MIFDQGWREERKAKKAGIRDGRAGIPSSEWTGGPVPFLKELHARYAQLLQDLHLSATGMVGRAVQVDQEFEAKTKEMATDLERLETDAKSLVEALNEAIKERNGLAKEAPEGKIARRRGIPTPLYIICLIALVVGEYLVTVPAVIKVLNENSIKAFAVAASISALSVILAHLFGISLKERLDRNTPQPTAILWGFAALAIAFMITLLFLSALRADGVQSEVTLGMSDQMFGTILFFVLQLTFIGAATGLAFYNHSELDSRIKSLNSDLKKVNKKIAKLRKQMAISPADRMNKQKADVQRQALVQEYEAVHARYKILAAIYVRFNILSQRNRIDSTANGLNPDPLPEFDPKAAATLPDTQFEKFDDIEKEMPYKVHRADPFLMADDTEASLAKSQEEEICDECHEILARCKCPESDQNV